MKSLRRSSLLFNMSATSHGIRTFSASINNYPLNTPLAIRAKAGDANNISGTNFPDSPGVAQQRQRRLLPQLPGLAQINQQENTTNGNYNGFQVGLRAQNRWNLSGEVDYTWSHDNRPHQQRPGQVQQSLQPQV